MSNKYGARRTYSQLCQREFASKWEAERAEQLHFMQMAGEIEDLKYQVKYQLCDKPRITVTLDFVYKENGETVYEDAKGVLTRDSRTKYAWLKEKYGITVSVVKK